MTKLILNKDNSIIKKYHSLISLKVGTRIEIKGKYYHITRSDKNDFYCDKVRALEPKKRKRKV